MTLADLIRKRPAAEVANANPAKSANHLNQRPAQLAALATLAVAVPPQPLVAPDLEATYARWLIYFSDREPAEVAFSPEATLAEVLTYSNAVRAEPVPEIPKPKIVGYDEDFEGWQQPDDGRAKIPGSERRRGKAWAMLDADPKLQRAVVVDDPDADPVVVMVARRSYTGEIEIPRIAYDPLVLMELLDRHAAGDEP